MSQIDIVLQVITGIACVLIFARAEPAINRLGRHSPLTIQIAMHFLTLGALGQVGAIVLLGDVPTLPACLALVGIAALLMCERRVRALAGVRTGPPRDRIGDTP